jgi:hypothetical protein
MPPTQIAYPGQPQAAPAAIPSPTFADSDDLTEAARIELANVALLALAQARDALARSQLGPQALKAVVAAAQTADTLLRRAGLDLANPAAGQAPQLTIREMTAERAAEIQAAVEAEYRGEMPGELVDDADEMDELPEC